MPTVNSSKQPLTADQRRYPYIAAVMSVMESRGLSRAEATCAVNLEAPELRLGYRNASVGERAVTRADARARYLRGVEALQQGRSLSRADAIAEMNRAEPDLRAAAFGR